MLYGVVQGIAENGRQIHDMEMIQDPPSATTFSWIC